jgi:hypothetical protein
MITAALLTAILYLTGAGDDARSVRAYFDSARSALRQVVSDPARRQQAEQALDDVYKAFVAHRSALATMGECLDKVDRRYDATRTDYERCGAMLDPAWESTEQAILRDRAALRAALTEQERSRLTHRAEYKP